MTRRRMDQQIERPHWLPESVWPFDIKTTMLEGTAIAYTDEGTGPALLLVHDGLWSFLWGQVIARLRDRFRVATLDFPGSGLSPTTDRGVTLETDSKLLESFVDQLGLRELTLVLHDLGGPVGLGMAVRRPELIRGLVLANTFAWPPNRALGTVMSVIGSAPVKMLNAGTNLIASATSGRFGIGRHLDDRARAAFVGPFREDRGPRLRFNTLMGSARSEIDYLEQIEQGLETGLHDRPVLTIFGERNDQFGFQRRFKEIFPHAEEMVIPKGNHFPMCDDPDGFAERVAGWHR